MSPVKDKTGVVFCNCGGRTFKDEEIKSLQARLRSASGEDSFIESDVLCTKEGITSLKQALLKKGISKLVFAGCTARKSGETGVEIAQKCSIAPSNIAEVKVPAVSAKTDAESPFGMKEDLIRFMVKGINKQIGILEGMETFTMKKIPLNQGVLIIGGGSTGQAAAENLAAYGYSPLLIEKENTLPSFGREMPGNVDVAPDSVLKELKGQVGSFTAAIQTGDKITQVECGAVLLASGFSREEEAWRKVQKRFSSPHIVPLSELAAVAVKEPRIPSGRSIAIILDLDTDEGKASTEMACRTALELQKRDNLQVSLFCRDIRVGSLPLEELYDEARESGVIIVKYEKEIGISGSNGNLTLTFTDAVLGSPMAMVCDCLGISLYGVSVDEKSELSEVTGVDMDSLGRLQGNNIHLFATGTNIPGIFIAGGCRGSLFRKEAVQEGQAAAGAIHFLLSQKELEVELSEAKVDAEKCAICLTCIRACPHNAMKINREESVAVSVPEVCKRCGICAGECPAKAITLPAYTDDILLA